MQPPRLLKIIFPCLQHLQILCGQNFVEHVDLCCLLPAACALEQHGYAWAKKNYLLSFTFRLS